MDAKYTRLQQSDPDKDSTALDFSSMFTYDYPKYFSYGNHSKKYRSAFTYAGGFDPNFQKKTVETKEASRTMRFFAAVITVLCYALMILTFPISWWFCHKRVPQYERLVVFRIGRLLATKGPGIVVILPCIDKYQAVDLRLKAFSIPPQTIMTNDGGSVELGGEVYHHVKDSVLVVNNVKDLNHSMREIAKTSLQRNLTKYAINDIESNKASISELLLNDLNQITLTWGLEITKVELSPLKVLLEPNPNYGAQVNPLEILGKVFMPQGSGSTSSSNTFEQLASHFQFAGLPQQPDSPAVIKEINETSEQKKPAVGKKAKRKFQNGFDLLEAIQPHLNSQLVHEFNTVYKFVVTGNGGGTFYLDLKNAPGSANIGEPPVGDPDVTLTLNVSNLRSLLNEQITPFSAYMTGKLEVEGDTSLASKLSELIDIVNK